MTQTIHNKIAYYRARIRKRHDAAMRKRLNKSYINHYIYEIKRPFLWSDIPIVAEHLDISESTVKKYLKELLAETAVCPCCGQQVGYKERYLEENSEGKLYLRIPQNIQAYKDRLRKVARRGGLWKQYKQKK